MADDDLFGMFWTPEFSNFHGVWIHMRGMWFPSAEHCYVAAKTLDMSLRSKISLLATPAEAKKFGRTLKLRSDWNEMRLEVMDRIIQQKFNSKHPLLQRILLGSGDQTIGHRVWWNDRYWELDRDGHGENHLGRLLMEQRDRLR